MAAGARSALTAVQHALVAPDWHEESLLRSLARVEVGLKGVRGRWVRGPRSLASCDRGPTTAPGPATAHLRSRLFSPILCVVARHCDAGGTCAAAEAASAARITSAIAEAILYTMCEEEGLKDLLWVCVLALLNFHRRCVQGRSSGVGRKREARPRRPPGPEQAVQRQQQQQQPHLGAQDDLNYSLCLILDDSDTAADASTDGGGGSLAAGQQLNERQQPGTPCPATSCWPHSAAPLQPGAT